MIESFSDEICLIASNNAEKKWGNKIDGFSLTWQTDQNNLLVRASKSIGRKMRGETNRRLALRAEIKKRKIDKIIINFANFALATVEAWDGLGLDIFVHVHGHDIHFDSYQHQDPKQPVWDQDYRAKVVALAEKVTFIVNSRNTLNRLLAAGVPQHKMRLKYFGVETQDYVHLQSLRKANPQPLRLLFIGRLVDCKGPDLVLQAFDAISKRGIDATLTMAGDGELLVACQLIAAASANRDKIELVGSIDRNKAQELYKNSDIFVCFHRTGPLTNREEAFGVTTIEAMSYGLPVITGNSGGATEIIKDGEDGFLADTMDDYIAKLTQLCESEELRFKIGKSAALNVQKNFSIEAEETVLENILLHKG